MKRQYVAPAVNIELYEITQSIANCITKINSLDSQCVLEDPDSTDIMKSFAMAEWFTAGQCTNEAAEMDGFDLICYHTSAQAAFTS